jgi:hypothetical protein
MFYDLVRILRQGRSGEWKAVAEVAAGESLTTHTLGLEMIDVFIGYDEAAPVAFNVLAHSIHVALPSRSRSRR